MRGLQLGLHRGVAGDHALHDVVEARQAGRLARHGGVASHQRPHQRIDGRQVAAFSQSRRTLLLDHQVLGFEVPEQSRTEMGRPVGIPVRRRRHVAQVLCRGAAAEGAPGGAQAAGIEQQQGLAEGGRVREAVLKLSGVLLREMGERGLAGAFERPGGRLVGEGARICPQADRRLDQAHRFGEGHNLAGLVEQADIDQHRGE